MKHNIELKIIIIDNTIRPLSAIKIESNLYCIADIAIIRRRAPNIKLPMDDNVKSHFLKFSSPFFFKEVSLSNKTLFLFLVLLLSGILLLILFSLKALFIFTKGIQDFQLLP